MKPEPRPPIYTGFRTPPEMSISLSAPRCSRSGASGALVSENGTEAASLMSTPRRSRLVSGAARNCGTKRSPWEGPRHTRYPPDSGPAPTDRWQALSSLRERSRLRKRCADDDVALARCGRLADGRPARPVRPAPSARSPARRARYRAVPHDHLARHRDDARPTRVAVGEDQARPPPPPPLARPPDGRQRRRDVAQRQDVVEAGQGDVGRHPDPGRPPAPRRPDRQHVVDRENAVRQRPAGREDRAHRLLPPLPREAPR